MSTGWCVINITPRHSEIFFLEDDRGESKGNLCLCQFRERLRTNGNQRPLRLYQCRYWEGTRTIIRQQSQLLCLFVGIMKILGQINSSVAAKLLGVEIKTAGRLSLKYEKLADRQAFSKNKDYLSFEIKLVVYFPPS